MDDDALKTAFEKEIGIVKDNPIFSYEYRKKKFIIYLLRTLITVGFYYFFWEYSWVKWTLLVIIPLNLLSLLSIFGWNYFLKRKIKKVKNKLKIGQ